MDRRTFLSVLAGLPFVGGLLKGKGPENVPSCPKGKWIHSVGFVRDFDNTLDLLEYVIHEAKGSHPFPVRIHCGSDVYDTFSKYIMNGEIKDWQDGIELSTERVLIDPQRSWEFTIYCCYKGGVSYYKIWPIRNFYQLEYIQEKQRSDADYTRNPFADNKSIMVWDHFIEN